MLIGHVRALQVLRTVQDAGSFSAAARLLGMTQSAVSQHVAALERATGQVLVDRRTRPVELTEAGVVLVRHGRLIETQLEGAEQALGELTGRRARRLRLGSFPTALTTFVPQAVARLRDADPHLVLSVVDEHQQGLVPRLLSGELDLAVVYRSPALHDDGADRLSTVALFDDPYRVLLPARHRLARRPDGVSLGELADEVWVGGRPGSAWFRILLQACRAAGFEPRTLLATDDHRAVQAFVAAGLGVAVVPGLAATSPLRGVEVRPLAPGGPVRRIAVAHRYGEPVSPAATAMTELLREVTRPLREPGG